MVWKYSTHDTYSVSSWWYMLLEFSQDLRTCLCVLFMVSHISTNWPLKEALFKILCISSQKARTYTFSRGPQFWNKNCVLNYAVDYGYSFCVGTCWYVEERGMKTRQMLLSVRKPGRMRIPEKAGGWRERVSCINMATRWQQRHAHCLPLKGFCSKPDSLQTFPPPNATVLYDTHSRLS